MWPFPTLSETHLAILLEQSRISLGLFSKTGNNIPYRLHAYQSIPLHEYECAQAKLFNPTRLHKIVHDFLGQRKKVSQVTSIGVSGPEIFEKFVSVAKKNCEAQLQDIVNGSMVWEERCLYAQDYEHDLYYCCGMTREQIFQFQLFALKNSLELVALTTPVIGCLALLHEKNGDDVETSRFGDQMMTQQNNIAELITIDTLAALLQVDRVLFTEPQDIKRVGQLLGLSLVGES